MRLRGIALSLCIACAVPTLAGCEVLQPTKTAKGQLYQAGDSRYDPYFSSVHEEQLAAASWKDEAKHSRRPIVSALSLPADAANWRILNSTRDKKNAPSLGGAVEQTTSSEIQRAHHLTSIATRLDELQRRGSELKSQVVTERSNLGADKADPAKVAKKDEVKRELSAAVSAIDSLASDARKGAKEAADLASKLKAAWTGRSEDERTVQLEEKHDEGRSEKKDEKREEERKRPKGDGPTLPKKPPSGDEKNDKPAKQPAQPSSDEVFNP